MLLDTKDKVADLIRQPLLDQGFDIADVVLSRFKNNATLRVFVYSKGGVTIDQCAQVSRLVSDIIGGTDLLDSGYTLEVSSPGLDRPLCTAKDFEYRVGETVNIEFVDTGRKKETAQIVSATADTVEFENDSGAFSLNLAEIREAKILF
ncbi:MAG: hypothetical protein OEW00_07090 [candidate division Zixibacteria bacterium]|nr:hypothetical protein [candidate division Zixibacteria bacterium]